MSGYRYYRGSLKRHESVEFDVSKGGRYITTCTVDVDLLLCGIRKFPCGNGEDMALAPWRQLDILELVRAERKKLTTGIDVKTMEDWHKSGLSFDEFCFPGDTVDNDIVDHFINVVPPITLQSDCTQAGEPYSHEADEAGSHRPTYTTFHRLEKGRWRYDGCCFQGENQNRVSLTFRQRRFINRIKEVWNAAQEITG